MGAGQSALSESARQMARAEDFERAAAEARAAAHRYQIAGTTEARTAAVLAPLALSGYHLLADRRWPGTRRANVDLIVVGAGGVFIVDTKAWADVEISGERIFRGQEDVTDSFDSLASLVELTQADLAEVGLAAGEVHAVVVLAGRRNVSARIGVVQVVGEHDVRGYIAGHGRRLSPSHADAVLVRAVGLFRDILPPGESALPPMPLPEAATAAKLFRPDVLHRELQDSIRDMAIEEWMTFLSPAQAKLVRRSYNGPSRIRGGAGTGKTVVGLHRAAHLARTSGGPVLFTTYVRTLPAVMRNLLARFAPDVVDRVEFVGMHQFALQVLRDRGKNPVIDEKRQFRSFQQAWSAVGKGSILADLKVDRRYWEEEIDRVIKGRGVKTFEEYANLARQGRRMQLPIAGRQAMWALYEEYCRQLAEQGVSDFADIISLAADELADRPLENGYRAVIADEAQDLSCVMVRMLHGLVGDAPDGLTLIGDRQQTIYPGGYTLAAAGVSVAGRGTVFNVNYRNTVEIFSFAARTIVGDEVSDIEDIVGPCDVAAEVVRRGKEPVAVELDMPADRFAALTRQVARLEADGCRLGGIGVLCPTNRDAQLAADALCQAGYRVVRLTSYDGRNSSAIKVGTVKRAKGLEFAQVLLPQVKASLVAGRTPPADPAELERWDLDRRELYVAMTRARDGLWLAISN